MIFPCFNEILTVPKVAVETVDKQHGKNMRKGNARHEE